MAPEFRCPKWSEKENAAGLGMGTVEGIAYVVVGAFGAAGYFMEGWIFRASVVLIPPITAARLTRIS